MAATEGHIQSAGKIPARHLMVIIGALLVEVAFSITLTGLSFFTPAVLGDFPGTRAGAFMIYFTLYGFASAASMPVAGMLIDRIKAPGLLVLGGLIAAGGLVVFPPHNLCGGFMQPESSLVSAWGFRCSTSRSSLSIAGLWLNEEPCWASSWREQEWAV